MCHCLRFTPGAHVLQRPLRDPAGTIQTRHPSDGLGDGDTKAMQGALLLAGPLEQGDCPGSRHPADMSPAGGTSPTRQTAVAEGHMAGTAPPSSCHNQHPPRHPPSCPTRLPPSHPRLGASGHPGQGHRDPAEATGTKGTPRPSAGRGAGGARRLPGPAENKVSSAPALTPGAICSGRAGGAARPDVPSPGVPPPRCHPSPSPSRHPGVPRRPHGNAANSPGSGGHRWPRRTAGPLRKVAPLTPNPSPAPGISGTAAYAGAPRRVQHPDGAPPPCSRPPRVHRPAGSPRPSPQQRSPAGAGRGAVALRAAAPGPCARRQTKAITKAAAGPRCRRPGQVPPGVRGTAPAPLPPPTPPLARTYLHRWPGPPLRCRCGAPAPSRRSLFADAGPGPAPPPARRRPSLPPASRLPPPAGPAPSPPPLFPVPLCFPPRQAGGAREGGGGGVCLPL